VDWGEVDGSLVKVDALCGVLNGASEWNGERWNCKGSWVLVPTATECNG
jgi:hypothetical protein